jgi:hypothetical protein
VRVTAAALNSGTLAPTPKPRKKPGRATARTAPAKKRPAPAAAKKKTAKKAKKAR